MEIRTEKQELLKKIALGVNVSGSKSTTLPILNNLLLETEEKNSWKINATDIINHCTDSPNKKLKSQYLSSCGLKALCIFGLFSL